MNILTRQGSKRRIASQIISHFPEHDMYIELFFGTGSIFFEKPLAKYNVLNDLDNMVYSLWLIMQNEKQREELVNELKHTPYHQAIFKDMKEDKIEYTPIYNALRLLILSNFSLLGAMDTMKMGYTNAKELLINKLIDFNSSLGDSAEKIQQAQFSSCDFRKVLGKISFRTERDYERAFIYADPPYFGTSNKYHTPKFKLKDFCELISMLIKSKIKFAVSEFNSPEILEIALQHKLNVITIGERVNLQNRRTEILITNYNEK